MEISGHAPGPAVVVTTVAGVAIAAIALGLRLFFRMYMIRKAGYDDALALFATVSYQYRPFRLSG